MVSLELDWQVAKIRHLKDMSFTQMEKVTRLIFPQDDDCILEYKDDDGTLLNLFIMHLLFL